MRTLALLIVITFTFIITVPALAKKELPKIVVWDLEPRNISPSYGKELTSILVSELSKLGKYEVYSQENVRTIAGWTAERMKLGCSDTQCLIALGQMDVAKLISGSVAKIGNRYSVSLNLFDTQNAKAENNISEFCNTEDNLIELVQQAARKLFGVATQTSMDEKFTNSIGMQFIRIQPGKFIMGSPKNELGSRRDEWPQHEVEITKPFYLGVYEVTQDQYEMIMHSNPSFSRMKCESCPVQRVTWLEVQKFIKRLNIMEKTEKYRLPTEAEWEYACRAGSKSAYSFGNDPAKLQDYAWFKGSDQRGGFWGIHPVGQKKPNAWGLYDVHGNVSEWTEDWYGEYENRSVVDPVGPASSKYKVFRGGGQSDKDYALRCGSRDKDKVDNWDDKLGFRLVRMP